MYYKTGKKIENVSQRNKNILTLPEPITVESVMENTRLKESTTIIELEFLVTEGYLRRG
jgi:hypothetical protein